MRKRIMVYRPAIDRKADDLQSRLERDWMTLHEAVQFIQRADANQEVQRSPFEQICDAIGDGELRARWLDPALPTRDGLTPVPDEPSHFVDYMRAARVRLQNGGEIDWGDDRWRKLLLHREDMHVFGPATRGSTTQTEKIEPLFKNEAGIAAIHEAISAVYDLAKAQAVKPPNVREVAPLVQRYLQTHKRKQAIDSWITELAGDPRYRSRRGKTGATVKGRLRPLSELKI